MTNLVLSVVQLFVFYFHSTGEKRRIYFFQISVWWNYHQIWLNLRKKESALERRLILFPLLSFMKYFSWKTQSPPANYSGNACFDEKGTIIWNCWFFFLNKEEQKSIVIDLYLIRNGSNCSCKEWEWSHVWVKPGPHPIFCELLNQL